MGTCSTKQFTKRNNSSNQSKNLHTKIPSQFCTQLQPKIRKNSQQSTTYGSPTSSFTQHSESNESLRPTTNRTQASRDVKRSESLKTRRFRPPPINLKKIGSLQVRAEQAKLRVQARIKQKSIENDACLQEDKKNQPTEFFSTTRITENTIPIKSNGKTINSTKLDNWASFQKVSWT